MAGMLPYGSVRSGRREQSGRDMAAQATQSTMRLFVALEISNAWKSHFSDLQADLERSAPGAIRWVRPDLLHLTVVFLDEQAHSQLGAIQAALTATAEATPAFRLDLGQPDLFGRNGHVMVIWVAVQDLSESLSPLHARVLEALRAHEVAFEARPFTPHVTLGRTRAHGTPLPEPLMRKSFRALPRRRRPAGFPARELVLFRSQLVASGPLYTALSVHRFAPPRTAMGATECANEGDEPAVR